MIRGVGDEIQRPLRPVDLIKLISSLSKRRRASGPAIIHGPGVITGRGWFVPVGGESDGMLVL